MSDDSVLYFAAAAHEQMLTGVALAGAARRDVLIDSSRMTGELWSLFSAVVLGLVHVSADSFSYKAQVGNEYTVGPRDDDRPRAAVAGRLHRAARNYTENLVLFVAVLFLLSAARESSPMSLYAAWVWVGARGAYLLAYGSGIPWTRTVCWQIAMVALLVMGADLFV